MLTAYFDIQAVGGGSSSGGKAFGKPTAAAATHRATKAAKAGNKHRKPREPRGTEAATTSVHARFEPLPPEDPAGVPRPAELSSQQAWQGLSDSITRDDGVAEFAADWDDDGAWEDEAVDDLDDASEPDFEPESLDIVAAMASDTEMSSSLDDDGSVQSFLRRAKPPRQTAQVYSGPLLCCEDDDFDSD